VRARAIAATAFTVFALASSAPVGNPDVARGAARVAGAGRPSGADPASPVTGAGGPAHACRRRKLALTDVLERGAHVLLAGTAARSLAGRTVKIVFAGREQVATALVGANGSFSTVARLPSAGIRASNRARYFAEIGRERSPGLKLTRRLILAPPTSRDRVVTLTGTVTPPLTRPVSDIVVQQQVACSKLVRLMRVTPSASGRFHVTLKAPVDLHTVTYELTTVVREAGHGRDSFVTYSLPQTVELPPRVSSVEPSVGPTSGGTVVKIMGTGFLKGSTVTIGAPATNVEVRSETEILAKTAAGTAGEDEVVVTDVDGASTRGPRFTYVTPPVVTSIAPAEGSAAGGEDVVIRGTGFVGGSTVTIGNQATGVEVASAGEIRATTPPTAAGESQVTVSLPDGVSSASAVGFTYVAPPSVTAISPSEGLTEGGTVVIVTGTGFTKHSRLTLGVPVAAFVVVSATEIVAETAPGSAGSYEVVLSNEYGVSHGGPSFAYAPAAAPEAEPAGRNRAIRDGVAGRMPER